MSNPSSYHDGGCACGHVRYRVKSDPLIVHCCHCKRCQCQTGSAFAVNALIEADRVDLIEGDVVEITVPSPSGKNQKIARCPECQVALWSYYLVMPGGAGERIRFIRVGTLDDPGSFPPDVHIHTSSKQPWVQLPSDVLAVDEYYVTREVWSQSSLARMAGLMKAVRDSNGSEPSAGS